MLQPAKITRAYFILTNRCQLRCRYCWTKKDSGNMSLDTAMAAAKFILKNANETGETPTLYLFGGEPLLQWDEVVVPLVNYIRTTYRKPCEIGITTNCLLLDEEKLAFLYENNIGMLVSLDGTEKTHNANRKFKNGKGSFDAVVKIIPQILNYYPNITARMTLTPETAGCLYEDTQFLTNSGFLRIDCVPNTFVTWSNDAIAALRKQFRLISDNYISSFSPENPGNGFRVFETGFRDVKQINTKYAAGVHRNGGCSRCGIGIDAQVAINHLGDLYPCHEANYDTSLRIGNIFDGPDETARLTLCQKYSQEAVHGTNCETCRYDNVCNGGCTVFNYMISGGDFNAVPQMYCVWKQLVIDECEYILEKMAQKNSAAFRDYFMGL